MTPEQAAYAQAKADALTILLDLMAKQSEKGTVVGYEALREAKDQIRAMKGDSN